jgi:hypothetical protein
LLDINYEYNYGACTLEDKCKIAEDILYLISNQKNNSEECQMFVRHSSAINNFVQEHIESNNQLDFLDDFINIIFN